MIPLCSRFDSALFTPKMSAIASYDNFSRSPIVSLRLKPKRLAMNLRTIIFGAGIVIVSFIGASLLLDLLWPSTIFASPASPTP